ncbi:MAG: molybdenum cofactor guanylyltransferase [Wenzhouxiangella sp.]
MTERSGIILAGGHRSAAAWPWRPGVSLLDQAERILRRAGIEHVLISGAAGNGASVADLAPGQGPLGGLASVLHQRPALTGQTLIVVPADMPALNPRGLIRLAEIAEYHGRGALFDLGPLPLALRHDHDLPEAIDDVLQAAGSLTSLAARLELPVLASLPDDGLDNLTSLEDLEALRQRLDCQRATMV